MGLLPTQVPAWQVSVCVQMLPSMQWVPSGAFGVEQTPVDGSQLPATWHTGGELQVTAVPTQLPPWQLSPVVHMLLSLQVVPLVLGVVPHVPDVVSQVGFWHAFAGHDFIVPGMHAPP